VSLDGLPSAWTVWNQEPAGQTILVYRPDQFDTERFPAECLPTITVSTRPPDERLPRTRSDDAFWYSSLTLEPDVRLRDCDQQCESRETALETALETARRFDDGALDYRSAYQVPRDAYLDALDDCTGRAQEPSPCHR